MSKRGHYLGGNTVVRGTVQSSKGRKVVIGALENLAAGEGAKVTIKVRSGPGRKLK